MMEPNNSFAMFKSKGSLINLSSPIMKKGVMSRGSSVEQGSYRLDNIPYAERVKDLHNEIEEQKNLVSALSF